MAYAQWVVITVEAIGVDLTVKSVGLEWGKFFKNPNKDDEIPIDKIEGMTIASGDSGVIASCGRENASSGTEGQFDLYDGGTHIGTYYWDCPWGSKTNTSTWTPSANKHYITEQSGANLNSGALGNVTIRCAKLP